MNPARLLPSSPSLRFRFTSATCAALALAAPLYSHAEESPTSKLHVLLNSEFSDKYLTPRGMIVQNQGLVFQQLALGFFNLYKGDSFVNDVTLVGGVWNCFGTDGLPSSDSNGAPGFELVFRCRRRAVVHVQGHWAEA